MKDMLIKIILTAIGIFLLIQFISMCSQTNTLELRVIEKNGLYIVQHNSRSGLFSDWDDEKRFRSRESASKYMQNWYDTYRRFKEPEIED